MITLDGFEAKLFLACKGDSEGTSWIRLPS